MRAFAGIAIAITVGVGLGLLPGEAQATVVGPCTQVGQVLTVTVKVADWKPTNVDNPDGTVVCGDKVFEWNSGNVLNSTNVIFTAYPDDTYDIVFDFAGTVGTIDPGESTRTANWNVTVTADRMFIDSIDVSADVVIGEQGGVFVTKNLFDCAPGSSGCVSFDQIQSVDGSTDTSATGLFLTRLWVQEVFSVSATATGSSLRSGTNTITQVVPGPGTLVLVGVGLLGGVLWHRRKSS